MKPSVYIETTIVSYLTCRPSRHIIRLSHEIITQTWWQTQRQRFDLYASPLVIEEASAGDPTAAAERLKALEGIPLLPVEPSAILLAERLAKVLVLPHRAKTDALHVAIAASQGTAFLLTWNCRHLANAALTDRIERTCADAGFAAPRVITPELLTELP
jgi:hypothetical protein